MTKQRLLSRTIVILILCAMTSCDEVKIPSDSPEPLITQDETIQDDYPKPLTQSYSTKYGEVNTVGYPPFTFDYSDNWSITKEEVTQYGEEVILSNSRGVQIVYSHIGNVPEGTFDQGGSTVLMYRVGVFYETESSFVPSYVQARNYSDLGVFAVVKLETTGSLDMRNDTEYKEITGKTAYAVLPITRIGIVEGIRHPFCATFAFWYSGYISFIASAPDGQFTEQEVQEATQILASFKPKY